ncbi:formate-tetrahydrofolate ligase [Acididesulfobacillus acetoxydans]|uniref:Formate--tetrahydrofolate ligase n=1 Tax=Acididesulfobacillus acetoxydans TaxID=1561005 RepID=A0A8S0VVP6_9FIRM|nr:formate--tetrahydrofolate ligase [Acididesulfobacillus acetoxydans]CAA7599913.1 formate-tetrahydrofolate ligase [Acididesulfobacillus acetoxydans]CEJ06873.1 Formate--tetrahydrofolate ligase [Acididesulfobacillus acetoxydans]
MPYDATELKDWQIAELADKNIPTPEQLVEMLALQKDELIPYGRTPKVDFLKVMERLQNRPDGKYIEVTAITPTPLGEGKTTTTLGLIEGLAVRGKNVGGAIRQPSGGPTMNIKGTAAGGGNALLIPMTEFSLGLTGDINDIMNAHNLAMVALNARMQHEANYTDEELAKRNLRRLDVDPKNVEMGWIIDFAAQGLRNIMIGLGGKKDGFLMQSKFGIAVSSELMAILAIAKDLPDLRERIGKIVVAYDKTGKPITTHDLEVDGAMAAWMRNTINPTVCYTAEGQPVFVHAGPFANIAIGQSSIIADRVGLKVFDYHVTESGFAADIGFEKFWNVKSRLSGLKPNVSVLVATIRALKMHGGGPAVVPGRPIPEEYVNENLGLVEKGCANLLHHLKTIQKSGIKPVVCINGFYTDTEAEVKLVKKIVTEAGGRCVLSEHWLKGGEGALELADAVIEACEEEVDFKPLYPLEMPLRQRVDLVAREVYGADGVDWAPEAEAKAKRFEADPAYADFATMMVKTHLSLTHDPTLKGVPKGWRLPIRDVLVYGGAKFLCPMAGTISLMPGTSSDPAYRRIDVDVQTGKVKGLF